MRILFVEDYCLNSGYVQYLCSMYTKQWLAHATLETYCTVFCQCLPRKILQNTVSYECESGRLRDKAFASCV